MMYTSDLISSQWREIKSRQGQQLYCLGCSVRTFAPEAAIGPQIMVWAEGDTFWSWKLITWWWNSLWESGHSMPLPKTNSTVTEDLNNCQGSPVGTPILFILASRQWWWGHPFSCSLRAGHVLGLLISGSGYHGKKGSRSRRGETPSLASQGDYVALQGDKSICSLSGNKHIVDSPSH